MPARGFASACARFGFVCALMAAGTVAGARDRVAGPPFHAHWFAWISRDEVIVYALRTASTPGGYYVVNVRTGKSAPSPGWDCRSWRARGRSDNRILTPAVWSGHRRILWASIIKPSFVCTRNMFTGVEDRIELPGHAVQEAIWLPDGSGFVGADRHDGRSTIILVRWGHPPQVRELKVGAGEHWIAGVGAPGLLFTYSEREGQELQVARWDLRGAVPRPLQRWRIQMASGDIPAGVAVSPNGRQAATLVDMVGDMRCIRVLDMRSGVVSVLRTWHTRHGGSLDRTMSAGLKWMPEGHTLGYWSFNRLHLLSVPARLSTGHASGASVPVLAAGRSRVSPVGPPDALACASNFVRGRGAPSAPGDLTAGSRAAISFGTRTRPRRLASPDEARGGTGGGDPRTRAESAGRNRGADIGGPRLPTSQAIASPMP